MGGFFGVASKDDCVFDLFFGTDYHSHLGTRRAGMAVYGEDGFDRAIHNIENAPFRTKFDKDMQKMKGYYGILIKGDIYINLNQHEKAIKCFDIGIKSLNGSKEYLSIEWYHKKALSLIQLQKYEEAMKCLNKTMDIILAIEIRADLNEEGIKLLKDCEKEKQELLNMGIADLKYSKHTINLSKLVYIFLALAILVNFLPVNGTFKLAANIIFLITAVASLAKQIYESRF